VSYLNPSGPKRSDGATVDELRGDALRDAQFILGTAAERKAQGDQFADFFQWQRLTEDVLHFQTFDSLPPEQQNAIKLRRQNAFKNSYIPWVVTDATALLTGLDDIDDMAKTAHFLKRYVLSPLATGLDKILPDSPLRNDHNLQRWRRSCYRRPGKRERKRVFVAIAQPVALPRAGGGLLAALFPAWRFAALLAQALQTTDGVFGVGLQLGPLIGQLQEGFFRGLAALGLPFSPEGNKYNQILASRVTARGNMTAAGWQPMHPEDRLSALTALVAASDAGFNEKIVIPAEDYPDAFNMFAHPWQELGNFAGLAASLPYNLGALALDQFGLPLFGNWSQTVGGPGATGFPTPGMNNAQQQILRLLEQGVCPGQQCDAELLQIIAILAQGQFRVIPHPPVFTPVQEMADNFNLIVDKPPGEFPHGLP